MKKIGILVIGLITFAILLFVIFTKADIVMSNEEALSLGEEYYLKFLWMVDGAFNPDKEDFIVNGKTIKDEDKVFSCKLNKKDNTCMGNNFEEEFNKTFANNINYDDVYSDGKIYTWYTYKDGKYIFNDLNNCSIDRMPINQEIKVNDITRDNLVFKVTMKDASSIKEKNYTFSLVLEKNGWRINKAYYRDICGLDYYIE